MKSTMVFAAILLLLTACAPLSTPGPAPVPPSQTAPPPTFTAVPSDTPPPTATDTPSPTDTASPSPVPTVDRLKAQVTADLLSCRYGPGPNYLYLYALRKGANITLVGRADGNNWVWVEGENMCWVNTKFLEVAGDPSRLPVVYPGLAKLPVSPYYQPTDWVGATRQGDQVEVSWHDVPLRAGDEEDEYMLHYIVEVWRCEAGELRFEPLATNELAVEFIDQPGCERPSHGRVFVQEKHGFAGPSEIPWPLYEVPSN
jgi:uncharacterized protein YraI